MPPPYPNWRPGITPHTHSRAIVSARRHVQNATVIKVDEATYRSCVPIRDEAFELVDPNSQPHHYYGALRIEVLCSWFGVKPPTTHPNIIVSPGDYRIMRGFTGNVVDDIRA
jgi:hypothetical protein